MSNSNDGVPPIPVPPAGNGTPDEEHPTSPYGPAATTPIEPEPEPETESDPTSTAPESSGPTPPAYTAPADVPPANPYTAPASPNAAPANQYAPPANPYASQQAPYASNPYASGTAAPPQGLSITSMVLGILSLMASFVLLGFLPAVGAVITGHLAQKRQPHARPFWLTGLITGYIGLVIALLTGFLFVIPLLMWMFTSGY